MAGRISNRITSAARVAMIEMEHRCAILKIVFLQNASREIDVLSCSNWAILNSLQVVSKSANMLLIGSVASNDGLRR